MLVRHLLMPDALDVAREISPATYINVMNQYLPNGMVVRQPDKYRALNRRITDGEHEQALRLARAAGLHRIDRREPHPSLRRHSS